MEVLLGYLLGLGTVVAIAKRGDSTKSAVAWTARQIGAFSGKVASSVDQAARLAREEYQRGREEQLGKPLGEGLDADRIGHLSAAPAARPSHLNGN